MGQILQLEAASRYCESVRATGKTMVFTNGIFDLLHIGHLSYLEKARTLGDLLVVGLNSDDSARSLKGPQHPILPQEERARLLAALSVVDVVVIFQGQTATELIQALRPDIYVKGGDYAHKDWPEKQQAELQGCQVELIPFTEGFSTSHLVRRIVSRFGSDGSID